MGLGLQQPAPEAAASPSPVSSLAGKASTAAAAHFKAHFSFGLSAKSNSSHAAFTQTLQRR